jgi:hypothetical protein
MRNCLILRAEGVVTAEEWGSAQVRWQSRASLASLGSRDITAGAVEIRRRYVRITNPETLPYNEEFGTRSIARILPRSERQSHSKSRRTK